MKVRKNIYIDNMIYEELEKEVGKGNVSKEIQKLIESKLGLRLKTILVKTNKVLE